MLSLTTNKCSSCNKAVIRGTALGPWNINRVNIKVQEIDLECVSLLDRSEIEGRVNILNRRWSLHYQTRCFVICSLEHPS